MGLSKLAAESSSTRRRAGDVACAGLLVATTISNWVAIAMIPSLIGSHPVLLEALGGSEASMVVAGAFARVGHVSLALALIAPVVGLANMDPFIWWGGRRWGRSLVARTLPTGPKTERTVGRAEQWFARWGGWAILAARFLPVPSPLLYAAAGWTGMALWRFVLLDLIGALAYAGLVVGLGYAIGHPAAAVVSSVTHYALVVTVVLIVVMVAVAIWHQRRRRTRPSGSQGPNRGDTGAPWLTLRLWCSTIWSRCSQAVRNRHAEPRGPTVSAAAVDR
jgi:membrane protein DedA with SNARE-associated domain